MEAPVQTPEIFDDPDLRTWSESDRITRVLRRGVEIEQAVEDGGHRARHVVGGRAVDRPQLAQIAAGAEHGPTAARQHQLPPRPLREADHVVGELDHHLQRQRVAAPRTVEHEMGDGAVEAQVDAPVGLGAFGQARQGAPRFAQGRHHGFTRP